MKPDGYKKDTVPKFTCTKSVPGAYSQGVYVHRNNKPALVGKLVENADGTFFIEIVRNFHEVQGEELAERVKEMRDWYYHNFIEQKEQA